MAGVIAASSRADAGAFLARLLRLDPTGVVRLRPTAGATGGATAGPTGGPGGRVAIWARLPFGVLVTRRLGAGVQHDVTVGAGDLLDAVRHDSALPAARDGDWHWPLPPSDGEDIESLPAADVRRVAAAAAETARTALGQGIGGRAVGSRRVRDALLDHVPIVVEHGGARLEIPQRLVQAVIRMDFVRDTPAVVRRAGPWVGLAGEFGSGWYRPNGESLNLHVSPYRSNG